MAEKEGEVGFSDVSQDVFEEMKVKVQEQLALGVNSADELVAILYQTFLVYDEDGNMWNWIEAIQEEVKAGEPPKSILQLTDAEKAEAGNVVELLTFEGKSSGDICQFFSDQFEVAYDEDLEEFVDGILLGV